jgi:nicotinamidase-related amidase
MPMTTLPDRPHTALLVIDVQNGVVPGAHDRDGVIANINTLVDKARADAPGRHTRWYGTTPRRYWPQPTPPS